MLSEVSIVVSTDLESEASAGTGAGAPRLGAYYAIRDTDAGTRAGTRQPTREHGETRS